MPGGFPLPGFLIVGAPRCGTTSLAATLGRHPEIYVPPEKELDFFDVNWDRGLAWYADQFRKGGGARLLGEATPWYFCSELALERIRITLRGVRILVLIRDPIERARSHYWSRALQGRETRSFEEVVEDELRVPLEEMRPRTHYLVFPGMYDRHLSRLRSRFSPERVKMLCFEEVVHAPASALAEVQDFLGVPVCLKELLHRNKPVAALLPGARRAIRRSAESGAPWTRVVRAALPDQLRRRLTRRLFALERRINRRGFVAPPIPEAVRARLEEAFEQTGVVRC